MMASSIFVSDAEFKTFHSIDRELFTILTIELWREPMECMQIMALWLWLERKGFRNVVKKMLSLPKFLISELADEAMACLTCLNTDQFSFSQDNIDIPLTQNIMEKEISLGFFHHNRLNATQGIARIMADVCTKALADIMDLAIKRNTAQSLIESQTMVMPFKQPLDQPNRLSQVAINNFNSTLLPSNQESDGMVHPDERTMFVTFSKGYPVREWEVNEFFTRVYGDCIESLSMQEVEPQEQSLFARIVFRSPTTIEFILDGHDKAKFSINGKHVWARKFVPKGQKPLIAPPSLSSIPSSLDI